MLKLDNISKLTRMYDDACNVDKKIFAEQRTNVMLRNGDHYNSATKKVVGNIRTKGKIARDQKIRITKNHCFRITDEYINAVLSRNPDTICVPYRDDELASVKDAEISNSVLKWIKNVNGWNDGMQQDMVHDTNVIGETYAVLKWDFNKGKIIGEDESGNPVYNGEPSIEERYAYDMKRDPDAKTFDSTRWVMFDTLIDKDEAKRLVKRFKPDKVESLQDAQSGDTVVIFDNNSGQYQQENGKVLLIEMFVRPCSQYPNGKFILFTRDFEITRRDLPLGLFTVYQSGFSKITSTPRYASILRVVRPYQIEINRASSKMAEHQITLGDDKVIVQNGGKIRSSSKEAGIRVLSVDGQAPTVMQGRTGSQYLDYVNSELMGMYQAANTEHLLNDKAPVGDPYAMLYQTMAQKARFVNYVNNYAKFERKLFTDAIKLCKEYMNETHLVKVVGRKDMVNIAEFKDIDPNSLDITLESSNGDIETKFGKVLTITQILQYAGSRLDPEQLGTLIRQLPYGNKEEVFSSMTLNYDTATDIILALDRGEQPVIPMHGDLNYYLSALSSRMVKSDFQMLDQQVQQGYQAVTQQLSQAMSAQALQAQQAAQGMIPAGGFLTTVNASWKNPTTGKVERIKAPSEAISWMMTKLREQGVFLEELSAQSPQVQADVGNNVNQRNNAPQIAPQAQGV